MNRPSARLQHGRSTTENGQATTEFTLLALVLTPLFIAVPLIGKYLDLAQTTEIAARYLAFEATVSEADAAGSSDAALAAEVRTRFFGGGGSPLRSLAGRQDEAARSRNALWTDPHARSLLPAPPADIAVETSRRPLAHALAAAGADGLALEGGHEHQVVLTVRLQDLSGLPPFDALGLAIRRHQVIHSGAWAAHGPADVSSRIERGGALTYPIAGLKTLDRSAGRLPALVLDPTPEVGRVHPEIVPCDRLEGGC